MTSDADNSDSATLDEMQRSMNSLAAMVKRLLENGGDLFERLDGTDADVIPEAQDPFVDTVSSSSLRSSKSSCSIGSSPPRQPVSDDPEDSSAAVTESLGFNSHVELEFQRSKVYSRIKQRHSISSKPSSFNPATRWSTLSSISLADISNISVISLPLSTSEIWGFEHYTSTSTPKGSLTDSTGEFRKLQWPKTDIGKSSGRHTSTSANSLLPKIAEDNVLPHVKMQLVGKLNYKVRNSRFDIS